MERKFLSSLVKLNMFLETPHPQELDLDPNQSVSSRKYLDSDALTLADCNLLPKLHIVKVRPGSTSWAWAQIISIIIISGETREKKSSRN